MEIKESSSPLQITVEVSGEYWTGKNLGNRARRIEETAPSAPEGEWHPHFVGGGAVMGKTTYAR